VKCYVNEISVGEVSRRTVLLNQIDRLYMSNSEMQAQHVEGESSELSLQMQIGKEIIVKE
ncbi:3828_t:CDS:2, partial [Cetraspora pellucida]